MAKSNDYEPIKPVVEAKPVLVSETVGVRKWKVSLPMTPMPSVEIEAETKEEAVKKYKELQGVWHLPNEPVVELV